MEAWIEFGRGPLFRLAFSLMVLGLLRVFVLPPGDRRGGRRSSGRIVPWKEIGQTWAAPGRLCRRDICHDIVSFRGPARLSSGHVLL
jgi:hypothetical protein